MARPGSLGTGQEGSHPPCQVESRIEDAPGHCRDVHAELDQELEMPSVSPDRLLSWAEHEGADQPSLPDHELPIDDSASPSGKVHEVPICWVLLRVPDGGQIEVVEPGSLVEGPGLVHLIPTGHVDRRRSGLEAGRLPEAKAPPGPREFVQYGGNVSGGVDVRYVGPEVVVYEYPVVHSDT